MSQLTAKEKKFEYTATGILGDKRQKMLNNELHLRSQLARTKRRGYSAYPGETYRYGLPYPDKDYGVPESLVWNDGGAHSTTKSNLKNKRQRSFSSDVVFGIPPRPSTPIGEVIEFKYQNDWIENERRIRNAKLQEYQAKKMPPGYYRDNRTSCLRYEKTKLMTTETDDGPLWQLPQFSNAKSQLDTFQSESQRERAFKNYLPAVECN